MGAGASYFSQNPMKRNFPIEDVPSFKIVLVGDSNVGKSSIFLRYTREQFDYSYQPTMNVNIGNVTKKIQLPFESLVSITLWDLPGREEIDLRRTYYKDLDAAIVVVDLFDKGSIEMAGSWKQDVYNNSFYSDTTATERIRKKSMKSQVLVPVLLLGNKVDKIKISEDALEPPAELQMLEDMALQHNFVGSVAVSAKESDGGVHTAIRSLVRYLLEKKMPKRAKKNGVEPTNLKDIFSDPNQRNIFVKNLSNIDDHTYEQLKLCKIPEFDEIFKECDKQVRAIETCCIGFLIAVKNFKRACCVSGITDTYKSTIEECVTGLKDTLKSTDGEDQLIAIEEAGLIKLELNGNKENISGPIRRSLEIYDKEVCKTTKRVLLQCPTLKINLTDHLKKLNADKNTTNDKLTELGFNKKQCKISLDYFEENLLRIQDTIELADESMGITDEQFKKIKNAMMW